MAKKKSFVKEATERINRAEDATLDKENITFDELEKLFYCDNKKYLELFFPVRECLYDVFLASDVYLFNLDSLFQDREKSKFCKYGFDKQAGIEIERNKNFIHVKSNRHTCLVYLFDDILNTDHSVSLKIGEGNMDNYINDLRSFGCPKDNTPLEELKRSEELVDMKAEFLRRSNFPVVLQQIDCSVLGPWDFPSDEINKFFVITKECGFAKRIAALKPEEVIKIAKRIGIHKNLVKSDVPDILDSYFNRRIEYER